MNNFDNLYINNKVEFKIHKQIQLWQFKNINTMARFISQFLFEY